MAMRDFPVLALLALVCMMAACGDDNPCVSKGQEPDLGRMVLSATICDHGDIAAQCQSLSLFQSQWACFKRFRVSSQDPPMTVDSILVRLEVNESAPIRDLLEDWDQYESRYWPRPPSRWPSSSCHLVRYSDSDTTAISVHPLGQETIPPTPESLLEAIYDIRELIRTKLPAH